MKFKFLLFASCLFFAPRLITQNEHDANNLSINKEKLQKKMTELIEENKSVIKSIAVRWGLLKGAQAKKEHFEEKFSTLTPEEQQKKIEKWLANPNRQKEIMHRCHLYAQAVKNRKLDDETVEFMADFLNEIHKLTPKNNYLCRSYMETQKLTQEDEKYIRTIEKRIYFHHKKKELEVSEQKALNEFETLDEYLENDYWDRRNYGKNDRYAKLRSARNSMKWH